MGEIILASGSPRRKQIMELAGINCEVIVSNADETVMGEPAEQVRELALRKATAVYESLPNAHLETAIGTTLPIIIAADTLVFIDNRALGKPATAAEAFEMLSTLQARAHTVYTGVAIVKGCYRHVFADAAQVHFRALTPREIHAYIATGEPFDKAGGYGIQERGSVLVDRIEGDFYTVMGLPISKVCRALAAMGYDIWGQE